MKQLQVGDKIKVHPRFGNAFTVIIERVTKTKAISEPINNVGARLEFKREYSMPDWIRPYSYVKWDTTNRELITNKP